MFSKHQNLSIYLLENGEEKICDSFKNIEFTLLRILCNLKNIQIVEEKHVLYVMD